jgi:hypothetical protein
MERLDNFLEAVVVALAAIFATATHVVEEALGFSVLAQLSTEAVVIGLTLTVVKELLAVRLLESSWLRRHLLGREYVEGTWVDVVFYSNSEPRVGIVHIGSRKSGLTYSGENLDSEGRFAGHFTADGLKVDFPRIVFHYTEDGGGENPLLTGVGVISFDRPQGPPGRYSGYCLDAVEKISHRLIGRRVDNPGDLRRLENPATRARAALEIAAPLLDQEPAVG